MHQDKGCRDVQDKVDNIPGDLSLLQAGRVHSEDHQPKNWQQRPLPCASRIPVERCPHPPLSLNFSDPCVEAWPRYPRWTSAGRGSQTCKSAVSSWRCWTSPPYRRLPWTVCWMLFGWFYTCYNVTLQVMLRWDTRSLWTHWRTKLISLWLSTDLTRSQQSIYSRNFDYVFIWNCAVLILSVKYISAYTALQ